MSMAGMSVKVVWKICFLNTNVKYIFENWQKARNRGGSMIEKLIMKFYNWLAFDVSKFLFPELWK